MQIQYIEGTVCVQGVIKSETETLRASLIVDMGLNRELVLHPDAAEQLELDEDGRLTVEAGDAVLQDLNVIGSASDEMDRFSKRNAEALGQVPVWGFIGLEAFDSDVVMLNIQDRLIEYGSFEIPQEGHTLPGTVQNARWIAGIEPDAGYQVHAWLCTGGYECVFDTDTAALAGSETADFENCRLAGLNLRQYTAVRPRDNYQGDLVNAECLIGNSFWQNFIVYIDRPHQQWILLEHPGGVISDLTEQAYYNAYAELEPADAVGDCLTQYPDSRLAGQARQMLLDWAIESGHLPSIQEAVEILAQGQSPKSTAKMLLAYARTAIDEGQLPVVRVCLEAARKEVLKTEDAPLLRARIDACRGWLALTDQDMPQARRHFLSALFVNPEDAFTNYLMGRYHQQNNDLTRAWARFLKASLADDPYEPAIMALRQLDRNDAFRNRFTTDDACDFLEGYSVDAQGQLTEQAARLKTLGGELLESAISKIQERSR